MAMRSYKKRSVGIKELKDRASEIVATVQRTGQAILITKNNQEVAQITPIPKDPYQRLVDLGILRPGPKPRPLCELKLDIPPGDASLALRAILEDREDD
jgi:prevent-host-death family protein